MCDQTEIPYRDGDVVWVKLGKCFWPGQVRDIDKLEDDIVESFKKKPIAAVQFFDEDKYEFVKNLDQISLYNGRKKMDFIKKGLDMFQKQKASSTFMNKFPEDVKKAELLTGGNPNILSDPHFSPKEKTSYRGLFDTNKSSKKEKPVTSRTAASSSTNGRRSVPAVAVQTPPRPITHPRFVRGETDHVVRIRDQQSSNSVPITEEKSETTDSPKPKANEPYKCQLCDFTSNRLNVIVLHNKFHSGDAANQSNSKGSPAKSKINKPKSSMTPSPAARPRGRPKGKTKVTFDEPEPHLKTTLPVPSTPKASSPSKAGTKRKILEVDNSEKSDEETVQMAKVKAKESPEKKIPKTPEKVNDKKSPKSAVLGKRKGVPNTEKIIKKSKSDEEIREKLLADWDDEDAEQEEREVELLKKKPKDAGDTSSKTAPSCFDFDDSKDAILDSKLEERAKKFVEGRKIPRLTDDKFERSTVENDMDMPKTEQTQLMPESSFLDSNASKTDTTADSEDFDKAIDCLLEETTVPSLPVVPNSSGILPDVVLDSNMTVVNNIESSEVPEETVSEFSSVEHDYSARQTVTSEVIEYGDILDINSMPVVMTDDILTEEATTSQVSQMPKIDLIPGNTHTIVLSENEMKMPPSVKSLVKAVRTSTADRSKTVANNTVVNVKVGTKSTVTSTLANTITIPTSKLAALGKKSVISKGTAGGKYIIVQSPSGQQSRLTLAPHSVADKPASGLSQHQMQSVAGGKVVILTKPQGQQKILTALTPAQQKTLTTGKLPTTQRIMTSSGQILTPINPRTRMPVGTKLTPITGQQMRVMTSTGKQTVAPKLTMQSLQTKVCLPSMQSIRQPVSGIRMVSTQKPQSSTILIQAPQTTCSSLIISKPTMTQVHTKTVIPSNQMLIRPRLLQSPMTVVPSGKPVRVSSAHPKILHSRSTLQPRMVIQRSHSPSVGVVAGMQPAHQVAGLTSQSQVIQKVSQPQTIMKIIPQPRKNVQMIQRAPVTQSKPLQLVPRLKPSPKQSIISTIQAQRTSSSNTLELLTSQSLPMLTPLQSSSVTSGNVALSMPQTSSLSLANFPTSSIDASGSSVLTSDQLSQVMASTSANQLGDAGATYVLLTIDDAGNLQQLNNQTLISYDGNDQSGQTFYIDPSSLETGGDLNNMILTIDNSTMQSGSGLAMNLGETNSNWIPSTSQDILAAALANTDVFQSEQDSLSCVVDTSSLLASIPSTILLPSLNRIVTTAANVSETSLTLNQPIMSPSEVTSAVTSFRAPPITTPHIPTPLYTPVSKPVLIQPIMSPIEVSTSVVPNILPAVFTTGSKQSSTPEPLPAFHPSMPLLSEEPLESTTLNVSHGEHQEGTELAALVNEEQTVSSYEQLVFQDDTTHPSDSSSLEETAVGTKASTEENIDLTNFRDQFLDEGGPSGHVVVTTNNSERNDDVSSYNTSMEETAQPEVPLLETALGSDMLQTFLPTNSEPESITENLDSNAIPHSMPLLSDDPVAVNNAESNLTEIGNAVDIGGDQELQDCETNQIELDQSEM